MPEEILNPNPCFEDVEVKVDRTENEDDWDPNADSVLYANMIAPFNKTAVKGVLWYQGETNVGGTGYGCMMNTMIESWRSLSGFSSASFSYVQLAAYDCGGDSNHSALSDFRDVQLAATSLIKNSAMVTAADLGDPTSPDGDIHPRNKTEVGRRLSIASEFLHYSGGDSSRFVHTGPLVSAVERLSGGVRVAFEAESLGGGLHFEKTQECPNEERCAGPVLVDGDGNKHQVDKMEISGEGALLDMYSSTLPTTGAEKVEYCKGDIPLLVVFNSEGIPLVPFTANPTGDV